MGLPEAGALILPAALGLSLSLGWRWGIGLLWGAGAIVLGRLASWFYLPALRGSPRVAFAAGAMGAARLFLYAAVAVVGIAGLGLEPLAICAGLILPGLVLKMRGIFGAYHG